MRILPVLALIHLAAPALAGATTSTEVLQKVLESDPWGLGDAEVSAQALLTDKRGASSTLAFSGRSRRYAAQLSKSLVRFSAPTDLAGAGFLQIQKDGGDDERYLFLPEVKKARQISGNLRSNAFMGTDFSFADLDRRDLRDSTSVLLADETLGKFPCYRLDVTPRAAGSQYARIELWVRKDNYIPLKWQMYDRSRSLLKTLVVQEVRRLGGRWFITRSLMTNHRESHSTQLTLENIVPRSDIPEDEFTVRNLEKI